MGPGFGEYLIARGAEIATQLTHPDQSLPFEPVALDPIVPESFGDLRVETALGDAAVLEEPVQGADVMTATWSGGDPAIDLPTVTLEVEVEGVFTPYLRKNGLALTSRGPEIEVSLTTEPTYQASIGVTPRTFRWTAKMPTRFSVVPGAGQPAGRLRFRVLGARPEAYELTTEAVTVGAP
jgi:hypothetical protein